MPPHRKQAVSVIRRGGDHLLSLIEGTLDIARIEGGKLTLDVKPMHFRGCVQQIVRMFELQAAGKGIAFRARVSGSLPEVVRADEKRLRQILINVLGNAVKFTEQRPGRVPPELCARDGAVRDRGHRPRHRARRDRADLRAVRARLGGRSERGRAAAPGWASRSARCSPT